MSGREATIFLLGIVLIAIGVLLSYVSVASTLSGESDMSGIEDVTGGRKIQEVMEQTWGHLVPGEKVYGGYILYTVGCYGDITCIQTHFRELPDSPWFYEDLHNYMGCNKEDAETGVVYLFLGSYCHTQPDKFIGVITRMAGGIVRDKIERSK